MTASFIVAPAAERDIIELGSYIERESRNAALQLVSEIYDCFPKLAERPALGHRRPDLTNLPVRFWTLRKRYLFIYRDASTPIEIVRVLSTYRDVVALLDKSPESSEPISLPDTKKAPPRRVAPRTAGVLRDDLS